MKEFPLPREDKIIVLDKFDLRSVSLTLQGLEIAGSLREWHYEDKETDGHERQAELDDGEVRTPEQ